MVLKYHTWKLSTSSYVRDILSLMPMLSHVRSCADEIVFCGVLVLIEVAERGFSQNVLFCVVHALGLKNLVRGMSCLIVHTIISVTNQ